VDYEWDIHKARMNLRKHGVDFVDAATALSDDYALTIMKDRYDFSQGKRGAIDPLPRGQTRVTIRIDEDILDWFRGQVRAAGGGNYQTLINHALREYVTSHRQPLEEILRRVVREELSASRNVNKSKRVAQKAA
jgi:uncharacterized protein (DUF4415 family)